ncbi:hypothetical protein ACFY3M_13780 [Streptomyces mirabilis]|uniref:hypothetical protein n=1 Tax=Streptomyces mirabilis TaxID=68239 RepID=UPI0036A1094A
MSKITEARPVTDRGLTNEQKTVAAEALAKAAGRLASGGPDDLVSSLDVTTLVGAMVYEVAARDGIRGGREISRAALDAVGDVPDGVTRVEFAVTAAKAAGMLDFDWSGDNSRLIPGIAEVLGAEQ